jgi:hypothetical protein
VRSNVLAADPAAPLKVYVVWFDMLPGDDRSRLDTKVLSDPRVTNYWDAQKVVGNWYSHQVTHRRGTTWDAFFLYGPQARWTGAPGPVITSGGPVIGARDKLAAGLEQLGIGEGSRGAATGAD